MRFFRTRGVTTGLISFVLLTTALFSHPRGDDTIERQRMPRYHLPAEG